METFRIKKTDAGKVFTMELAYDQPNVSEPNQWGKKEYSYGVRMGGQEKFWQASEAASKEMGPFRKGDMIDVKMVQDGNFVAWVIKKHGEESSQAPPEPQAPPPQSAPQPERAPQPEQFAVREDVEREQKREYWAKERESKNRISALACAVDLFAKAFEPREWSPEAEKELISRYRSCKSILEGRHELNEE